MTRRKGIEDGRTVYVSLTQRGEKVDRVHSAFHKKMIRNITKNLTADEEETVYKVLVNLNDFFKQNLSRLEESK